MKKTMKCSRCTWPMLTWREAKRSYARMLERGLSRRRPKGKAHRVRVVPTHCSVTCRRKSSKSPKGGATSWSAPAATTGPYTSARGNGMSDRRIINKPDNNTHTLIPGPIFRKCTLFTVLVRVVDGSPLDRLAGNPPLRVP